MACGKTPVSQIATIRLTIAAAALAAVKWTPTDAVTVTANYIHTNLWGRQTSAFPTMFRRSFP